MQRRMHPAPSTCPDAGPLSWNVKGIHGLAGIFFKWRKGNGEEKHLAGSSHTVRLLHREVMCVQATIHEHQ